MKLLLLSVLLASAARADVAPRPGSEEDLAIRAERAKKCRPGEAAVVCGVRAGTGWHEKDCADYDGKPGYYRLKSFSYEETYCLVPAGGVIPKKTQASIPEPAPGFPPGATAGVGISAALGLLALWVIRRRRG